MSQIDKYQWRTSIFNYKGTGREWTTGFVRTKQEAINDLIDERMSGFILLDNPESEGDIQDIEFIKITKDEKGNFIVSEFIFDEKAFSLFEKGAYEVLS